jgi:hypothetical protein
MTVDPDKPVEPGEPPTQLLEDLVARLRSEQAVRTGILTPVDRFHRNVQKELVPGPAGDLGLMREIRLRRS